MSEIVRLAHSDVDLIDPLRQALWPDSSIDDLKRRLARSPSDRPDYLVLLVRSEAGGPVGFAEVSLRSDYVNGCDGLPVVFLEGIYVDPAYRKAGIGRALVAEAARWASELGVGELASDAFLEDRSSHRFHRAVGLEETERVVYFRRMVGGTSQ